MTIEGVKYVSDENESVHLQGVCSWCDWMVKNVNNLFMNIYGVENGSGGPGRIFLVDNRLDKQ